MRHAWRVALPGGTAVLGSAAALYLLADDVRYFLEPRRPRDLGEAGAAVGVPSNRHVRVRGWTDLAHSLRVGHREGDFRLVRLAGTGIVARVSAPAPPGTPPRGEGGLEASGLFDGSGRIWRAEDAGAFYAPMFRRLRADGPITHLLVTGEEPADAWPSFVAAVAVAVLGVVALALAARAILRLPRSTVDADPRL